MELDLKARTMISSGADDALEGKSWQGGPDTGPPRQRGWKGTGVWTRGRAEKRRRRNILGWTRGTLVTNVEKGLRGGGLTRTPWLLAGQPAAPSTQRHGPGGGRSSCTPPERSHRPRTCAWLGAAQEAARRSRPRAPRGPGPARTPPPSRHAQHSVYNKDARVHRCLQ